MTSSFVAVMQRDDEYSTAILTNKMWNPITWDDVKNSYDAYTASKKYAELAAREYIASEKPKFNFATVNPPLVVGPQVFDSSVSKVLNESNQFVLGISHTDVNATGPQEQMPISFIDVRNTAEFHILPLEVEDLSNKRQLIACAPFLWSRCFKYFE